MSQPKHRRRRARRRAQRAPKPPRAYVRLTLTGEARNPVGRVASLDTAICVGFGAAAVLRDGKVVIDGERERRRSLLTSDGVVTLRQVERHIRRTRQGHRRWTASVRAPLWDATWERRRPGKWICVEAGMGFA